MYQQDNIANGKFILLTGLLLQEAAFCLLKRISTALFLSDLCKDTWPGAGAGCAHLCCTESPAPRCHRDPRACQENQWAAPRTVPAPPLCLLPRGHVLQVVGRVDKEQLHAWDPQYWFSATDTVWTQLEAIGVASTGSSLSFGKGMYFIVARCRWVSSLESCWNDTAVTSMFLWG